MEVQYEMDILKSTLKDNKMETDKSNNFLRFSDYEEEYSHNQIRKMQDRFIEEAQAYLKENYKGRYVIFRDWCVHITTVEFHKEKNIKNVKYC